MCNVDVAVEANMDCMNTARDELLSTRARRAERRPMVQWQCARAGGLMNICL